MNKEGKVLTLRYLQSSGETQKINKINVPQLSFSLTDTIGDQVQPKV